MIFEKLDKIQNYLKEEDYKDIKKFLDNISKDIPEGEYPIRGEDIFARVQEYETLLPKNGIIEAHNTYIDVQFSIFGAEGISVFDRNTMKETLPYDADKDVIFFDSCSDREIAHTNNIEGYFTMLFPNDAHRPKERVGNIAKVKKAVIKIKVKERYA